MHVLLVEDDPSVRGAVDRALRTAGHTVDVAIAGDKALAAATATAYDAMLLANPKRVLSRDVIFEKVWGYDFGPDSNSLDVYIGYLRRKLETNGEKRLIHTVRGVGYVLRDAA